MHGVGLGIPAVGFHERRAAAEEAEFLVEGVPLGASQAADCPLVDGTEQFLVAGHQIERPGPGGSHDGVGQVRPSGEMPALVLIPALADARHVLAKPQEGLLGNVRMQKGAGHVDGIRSIAGPDLGPIGAGQEIAVLDVRRDPPASLLVGLIVGGHARGELETRGRRLVGRGAAGRADTSDQPQIKHGREDGQELANHGFPLLVTPVEPMVAVLRQSRRRSWGSQATITRGGLCFP